MRAAVHIVPAAGVENDKGTGAGACPGRHAGSGIATAALQTCERLGQPVDLILLAVPAGSAEAYVARLVENGQAHGA